MTEISDKIEAMSSVVVHSPSSPLLLKASLMRIPRIAFLPLALVLSGCIARTAVDIVTLPVKVVSAGVDAATTSQSEADQRRGRELREAEERQGREARRREREAQRQRERDEDEDEPDR
jgi:hypothetical protein